MQFLWLFILLKRFVKANTHEFNLMFIKPENNYNKILLILVVVLIRYFNRTKASPDAEIKSYQGEAFCFFHRFLVGVRSFSAVRKLFVENVEVIL